MTNTIGATPEERDGLVVKMLYELHSHVPEDQRPMSMSDLSDEQAERARKAVDAVIVAACLSKPAGHHASMTALEAAISETGENVRADRTKGLSSKSRTTPEERELTPGIGLLDEFLSQPEATQAMYDAAKAAIGGDGPWRVVWSAMMEASDIPGRIAALSDIDREEEEAYQIGLREGYEKAVQDIDLLTGGDGEYRYCLSVASDRHCPDAETMKARIADRFADRAKLREALADLMCYHDVPGPVDAPLKPLLEAGFAALNTTKGQSNGE